MASSRFWARCLAGLFLITVFEGGLVLAVDYDDEECVAKPQSLSTCSSYGAAKCNGTQGCSGDCYTCGGPGSFPDMICVDEKDETCPGNEFGCGARTNGNCQQGATCFCDGMTGGGSCTFHHC